MEPGYCRAMRGIILPLRTLMVVAVCCAAARQASAQDATPLPRLTIEDDGAGSALTLIDRAGSPTIPAAVRVILPAPSADATIDTQLASLQQRRIPLWLSVPAPATASDLD